MLVKLVFKFQIPPLPSSDGLHATPKLKQTIDGDFTLLTVDSSPEGGEETDNKVEDREADYGHRRLQQQEAPVARSECLYSYRYVFSALILVVE